VECTYRCGVLNNTFCKTYNLKVHQCVHTGEVSYHRDGCNKTFSIAYNLKVHKDVHTGERPYCCGVLIKH
jgi:KRAB domain-containing zinc finger protein